MTDMEKIKKAIEVHLDFDANCNECTYENDGWCTTRMLTDALALLKEQQTRIDELESLRRIEREGR